jgi:hypothetical protein
MSDDFDDDEEDFDLDEVKDLLAAGQALDKHMEGLHFVELLDLHRFQITQSYLMDDLKYQLSKRFGKMNKKIKKGVIWGFDD